MNVTVWFVRLCAAETGRKVGGVESVNLLSMRLIPKKNCYVCGEYICYMVLSNYYISENHIFLRFKLDDDYRNTT